MDKQDMSKECGFKDIEMFYKRYNGEISQQEHDEYYKKFCGKCEYASDICMYGEE
jgi:hypothetical protein